MGSTAGWDEAGLTDVDVELLGTAEREEHLGEEVDAACLNGCLVGRGDQPHVRSLVEGRVPENSSNELSAVPELHRLHRRWT